MKNVKSITVTTSLIFVLAFAACKKSGTQNSSPDEQTVALSAGRGVPLVPASGALLGHYYGNGTITETDARIGRRPAIHLTYYSWTDHWSKSIPTKQDLAEGRIPLINWEPYNVKFKDIVSGKYDTQIRLQADEAKAIGRQFFLDFAAEMNGDEAWGDHNPDLYVKTFRHIHDIFIARGATNAVWVWCPNNADEPGTPAVMQYYPGNAYVDWVGADGYNWGTSDSDDEWETFYQVFEDIYSKISVTGKPMMIGEMASDEIGGDKAKWISQIVPTLKEKFPAIKAVVWFDVVKERHWQINSSQTTLNAYRAMAKNPYFN
ncbi:glycoside hydrolase family 26 protein [Pedobacter hartonius]|uniref:Glycosyl hydrolase family 26 n=1 Tax=Pedobacter hartonius TaxID=425514 RepID=A0A1H4CY42_9SPHI|nr:glycosyl hydrolase [Pedobacter hartonius]SEA65228.1 Glycosyl hydrolase family 26 [Pedobacter hartonius]